MWLKLPTDFQGLHFFLARFSVINRIKVTNRPQHPKMTNGLIQHITVEESTGIQWANQGASLCKDEGNTWKYIHTPFKKAPKIKKKVEFANSIDPDKEAQNELPSI